MPRKTMIRREFWRLMFLSLLLLVLLSYSYISVGAEGKESIDFNLDDREIIEPEDEVGENSVEPAPETAVKPEITPEPDVVIDAIPEVKEVVGIPVPFDDETKRNLPIVEKVGRSIRSFVKNIINQSKNVLDQIKHMSKSDAKKVASAVLGIWVVSVGVGWLAQIANVTSHQSSPVTNRL